MILALLPLIFGCLLSPESYLAVRDSLLSLALPEIFTLLNTAKTPLHILSWISWDILSKACVGLSSLCSSSSSSLYSSTSPLRTCFCMISSKSFKFPDLSFKNESGEVWSLVTFSELLDSLLPELCLNLLRLAYP